MRIKILAIGEPETVPGDNGRDYQTLEVLYKNENGERKSKKLVSFSNPGVFKTLKGASANEEYDVKVAKNTRGGNTYYNWTQATPVDGSGGDEADDEPTPRAKSATRAPKAVTITEADRQRLIVRQSSAQRATDLAIATGGNVKIDSILRDAERFEAWVFRSSDEAFWGKQPNADVADEEAEAPVKKRGRPAKRRVLVEPAPSDHNKKLGTVVDDDGEEDVDLLDDDDE